MWIYEKKLQFPVDIKMKDLKMAKFLFTQYGGPDSELSASQTYLAQRYTMPTPETKALLNDIGTEELAHWEMLGTMIYQLTKDATPEEMREAGLGDYYATRGKGVFQSSPSGEPWTSAYIQVLDDPIANLTNDMAAEQKARAAYERLMNLTDDISVIQPLSLLREREIVHFQRFGEARQTKWNDKPLGSKTLGHLIVEIIVLYFLVPLL